MAEYKMLRNLRTTYIVNMTRSVCSKRSKKLKNNRSYYGRKTKACLRDERKM